MTRSFAFFVLLALSGTSLVAAETDVLSKVISEIYVPKDDAYSQIPELQRQLGVRMFIDIGTLEQFKGVTKFIPSFAKPRIKVSDALNEYCASRDLQWHYWPEAKAVWIEWKKKEWQHALRDLSRPLNYAAQAANHPFEDPDWLAGAELAGLVNSDAESRKERIWLNFSSCTTNEDYPSFEHLRIKINDSKWPKTPLDFVAHYLLEEDDRAVRYKIESEGVNEYREEVEVIHHLKKDHVTTKQLVQKLFEFDKEDQIDPKSNMSRDLCWREAMRRLHYDKGEFTKQFIELGGLKIVRHINTFSSWDNQSRYDFLTELFNRSDRPTKFEILNSRKIPDPSDGLNFHPFWNNLAASDDKELSQIAKSELEIYKEDELNKERAKATKPK
jgi:hypothetical protein